MKGLEDFFSGIKLDGDVSEQALETLRTECVTVEQLIRDITAEDLEEVGIGSEARDAIIARAQVRDLRNVHYSVPSPDGMENRTSRTKQR